VRNEEILHGVRKERNFQHTIKKGKTNWIGHTQRRNCFLKHIIEGKIEEVKEGQRRRHKQLLDDLKERK
jgi:hypothetical protein